VLRGLLPPGCGVGWTDPGAEYPLLAGEALPGAVPTRLREFAAGRAAARMAMASLGLPALPVPQGGDRAPVWPAGLNGSITHTRTACLAAVTAQRTSLGIDLEKASPLSADLWPLVLSPDERAMADRDPEPGLRAKMVFCAKEAAYKAQYRITGQLYGFDGMAVVFDAGTFAATFTAPVGRFAAGDQVTGRIVQTGGHILAVAAIAR